MYNLRTVNNLRTVWASPQPSWPLRRSGRAEKRSRRIAIGLIALALAAGGCGPRSRRFEPPAVPPRGSDRPTERFEGDFEARLREAGTDQRFRAMADLTEQVDLVSLVRRLRASGAGKRSRRDAVVRALDRTAARQQARLRPLLERLVRERALDSWIAVAIVNRVVVEGRAAGVLRLAESPEVARIRPEWTSGTRDRSGRVAGEATAPGDRFRSWAIDAMGVPEVRKRGYDGAGVVVASIDTGAFAEHEQLRGRQQPGERGWFDPVQGSATAFDSHGHGTSVLSQAVGGNPDGREIGVAPGARWAAALGNWQNRYSRVRMTLAADWILREARPDVLVNAWSHDEGKCPEFDRPFIDAWKAAEIFVVFPAGNSGPAPGSAESPASLGGVLPDGGAVFSVGGLAPGGSVHEESSRGPSPCGAARFPTVAAPGAALPFALPPSARGYSSGDGTSLSAGLVAGGAALLLQADPEMSPDEVERALVESARDVPPPGADDGSGAGSVDLAAALDRVLARRAEREGRGERR